jgi:hypothetical protein
VDRVPQVSVGLGCVTGSIASGVKRTLWSNGGLDNRSRDRIRSRDRTVGAALDRTTHAAFAAMCMILVAGIPRRGAAPAPSSTLASRRLANAPNPSQRTCRSA